MEHEDNPACQNKSGFRHGDSASNGTVTQSSGPVVQRTVSAKGSGGVSVTVVVVVQQGNVWMSIEPPFTWEAIMEPGKVDDLIRTLAQARDDARRMVSRKRAFRGGGQPAGNGTVIPGSKVAGSKNSIALPPQTVEPVELDWEP